MTYEEFGGWVSYRAKYGPLNPMLRMDAAFARTQVQRNNLAMMAGKNQMPSEAGQVKDFMPWPRQEPEEMDIDAMNDWFDAHRKRKG